MVQAAAELRALIFDVDGTLADTERDGHRLAFNQAFTSLGIGWHWSVEEYGELLHVAGGKERIRHYLQRHNLPLPAVDDLDDWIADLHQRKTQQYRAVLASGAIPLRPGVQRLLQEARSAGLTLAIATTSALPNVLALLETTLGPDSPYWFAVIAAGDVVPQKKPAPDIYQYVLQSLELQPHQCLVVEDSAVGLQAATGAELPTLITLNDYSRGQDFRGARAIASHLGDPGRLCKMLQGPPADLVDVAYLRRLATQI
jgi:beta-phosphoglucomutase-like phosphatase (HAD superfamily)